MESLQIFVKCNYLINGGRVPDESPLSNRHQKWVSLLKMNFSAFGIQPRHGRHGGFARTFHASKSRDRRGHGIGARHA